MWLRLEKVGSGYKGVTGKPLDVRKFNDMKELKLLFLLCFTLNICNGQWVKLSNDTIHYYSAIEFINSDTGFIAGIDWYNSNYVGVILRTMDGGDNWDTTRVDPGVWFMSMQFINDTLGYAGGQDGIIFKTTDMGNTWIYDYSCSLPEDVSNFIYTSHDTCFYQKFNGNLLITDSAGGACTFTGNSGLNSYYPGTGSLRFIDSQNGYISGGDGKFSKTTDGGLTWIPYNGNSSITLSTTYMTNSSHGVMVGTNGKTSVTQDGGSSWSLPVSISLFPILDIALKDSSFGYAVGGNDIFYYGSPNSDPQGFIWRTNDGGYTWGIEDSNSFDQLTAISIVNDSLAFAVGYRGLILRNSNLLFSSINDQADQSATINVFPNPILDQLNIIVDNTDVTEIIFFDITSRVLFRKQFTNKISLNTTHFVKGMYFYKISNKKGILKNGNVIKM